MALHSQTPSQTPSPITKSKRTNSFAVLTILALSTAVLALLWPRYFQDQIPSSWGYFVRGSETMKEFICDPNHRYTTSIVSVDPLVVYIEGLVSGEEARRVVQEGTPSLTPSLLQNGGQTYPDPSRTSRSAGLTISPALNCILARSRSFLGSIPDMDGDFGTPQIVSYRVGERFNLHRDWYPEPQRLRDGRMFNREASFFVTLEEEGLRGGETWFPKVQAGNDIGGRDDSKDGYGVWAGKGNEAGEREKGWRRHEDGGIAFKPITGNAVFWMNLFRNGTGDERVVHAGLPVEGGNKTAMNIWPRRFF